jgi:hypothetical protein
VRVGSAKSIRILGFLGGGVEGPSQGLYQSRLRRVATKYGVFVQSTERQSAMIEIRRSIDLVAKNKVGSMKYEV